ncbi:vanomycin resistance protein VanB [Micromonospora echinospora]|uniref:VanW family protein n=1 Tax=Micromonospora echinospora TaxID=1877 RepID=UPI000B5B0608|nr:VanW family protein [Micromonospora echinospora]OZV72795.1 vanomycin resistance protein VanB [Micromonospora echinospora]
MPVTLYGDKLPPADDRPTVQVTAVTWPAAEAGPPQPATGPEPTGPAPDPSAPRGGRRRRVVLAAGMATVLLAAGAGAGGYAYAGEVPRGTTVLGTEVGGKSRADAARALRAELDRRAVTLAAPVPVRIGDRTTEIMPADVGLTVDVEATVAAAVEAQAAPLSRLFGSRTVEPVVTVDPARLETVLEAAVGPQGRKMTMPKITYSGTTPKKVHPKPALTVDAQASAEALRRNWLGAEPVTVPLVEKHPATTAEEVDRLVAELAAPAVAAPVKLTTQKGSVTIPASAIARSLSFPADKTGKLTPKLDVKKLRTALGDKLAAIEVEPRDASMTLAGGTPKAVPSRPGQRLDDDALGRDLLAVLPKADGRTVDGVLKPVEAKLTTEKVTQLGIKEKVSSFTTHFTGGLSSARSKNIVQIAKDVDGTVVQPGETFSLNGHTGERGYKQGYHDAPVILDGKLVPGVGGGTSQFTTTLFNAIYYAGLEDVEHKPHSYWFSRYPAVIESTIFYPNLDFKFRNNTPYGVMIDTSYTSSSVTVAIWGTKIYDSVKTEYSPRRNITRPKVIHLEPGPSCIATNGINGFTQDAYRIIRKDGEVVKREKFTWTYQAEPRFVCGP